MARPYPQWHHPNSPLSNGTATTTSPGTPGRLVVRQGDAAAAGPKGWVTLSIKFGVWLPMFRIRTPRWCFPLRPALLAVEIPFDDR
jgi:hypothetical protein